jgi:hypothetical protein
MYEPPKAIRLFIDVEFTDFMNRDLISIGLAADNGEEFYGENLEYIKAWQSDWVGLHVVPLLQPVKYGMSRRELSARLWCWMDELPADFLIVTVDYRGDGELLFDLFGEEWHPKMMEVQNCYVNMYTALDAQCMSMGGSDALYNTKVAECKTKFDQYFDEYFFRTKEVQHHALSDAKANREAYTKLISEMGIPI